MKAMIAKLPREKTMRIMTGVLGAAAAALAAWGVMQTLRVAELEEQSVAAAAEKAKVEADAGKLRVTSVATEKKAKEMEAAVGAAEGKLKQADALRAVAARADASIAGALESAAKGAKPPRAEAWAAAGVARALTAGEVDAAAQALLDKALAVDKANCTARLALAAGGKGEAPADCK